MSLDDKASLARRRSFIKNAAVLVASMLSVRAAAAQANPPFAMPGGQANMVNDLTFEDVRKLLDLSPMRPAVMSASPS